MSLFASALFVIAGALLAVEPKFGFVVLTMMSALFLTAHGIAIILTVIDHRQALGEATGWFVLAGIMNCGMAALIWRGLPGIAVFENVPKLVLELRWR